MAELPSNSACKCELAMLASKTETRVLRPLPGASIGLSVISSCVREGVLAVRGGGIIVSGIVSITVDSSIEALDASRADGSCCTSSWIVYMSGLG
jgi:hypothetical protein